MKYIIATATTCTYFTVGKCYPILDGSFETGIYTADDDNIDHYLSPEYLLHNFKEIPAERVKNDMTYEEIKRLINGRKCPLSAENENGEFVIISEGEENGIHFYETQTAQKNDYVCTRIYWADGTYEELYERDDIS